MAATAVDFRAPAGKQFTYRITAGEEQHLEVYYPPGWKAGQRNPGLVLFHGGGWSGGSLNQFRRTCNYFASRGMVAITANYRMHPNRNPDLPAGESRKRICVLDTKACLRWVAAHAADLGIDPTRVVTGGCSAGGHISTLALLNDSFNHPGDEGPYPKILGVTLFSAAFTTPDRDRIPDVNVFKNLTRPLPPTIMLMGADDQWKAASDQLVPELRKIGTTVHYTVADAAGHNFWGEKEWLTTSCAAVDDFLVGLGLLAGRHQLQGLKAFRQE